MLKKQIALAVIALHHSLDEALAQCVGALATQRRVCDKVAWRKRKEAVDGRRWLNVAQKLYQKVDVVVCREVARKKKIFGLSSKLFGHSGGAIYLELVKLYIVEVE